MSLKKKYKYIFFDLDRTLWDFEKNSKNAIQTIIKKHKLDQLITKFDEFMRIYNLTNDRLWENYRKGQIKKEQLRVTRFHLTLQHFGIKNLELAKLIDKEYLETSPRNKYLMPDAIEILDYLSKSYKLYIITNGFKETQHIKLNSTEIIGYFEKVITSDDVGYAKPDIRMFHAALSSINAKKTESLMVGDDYKIDIIGAQQYGIDQIFYNFKNESIDGNPTYEIHSLLEIRNIL
ncbi:YjjG family noncanonical pyrimidine nucleotidase [Bacteroidota bacterium]